MVNNVETIASRAVHRQRRRATGSARWARESSPGPKIYSLSGHVEQPGQYEAPLGTTLRQLLELAGGMKDGIPLKFWTPGGSSTPLFTAEHLDVPLDFEGAAAAGSMLGTTAVHGVQRDRVRAVGGHEVDRVLQARVLRQVHAVPRGHLLARCRSCERMVHGEGTEADIETLLDICDNILGRSFCALGDGAVSPITSGIKYFRHEFLDLCAEQPAVAHPTSWPTRRSHPHDLRTRGEARSAAGARGARPADHRRRRGRSRPRASC